MPRIILLDTDTVVLRPIIKLWSVFESFGDRAVSGIAREQSNLYENMVRERESRRAHLVYEDIRLHHLPRLPPRLEATEASSS